MSVEVTKSYDWLIRAVDFSTVVLAMTSRALLRANRVMLGEAGGRGQAEILK